ncbi:hypothetical protein VLL09_04865 [Dehalococcoides mccartyi]|uniref:Uncharacterized protein n=1 Tax=Dehalococcoides mccartyi TaxID=61435 RepID=A0AB38Z815_9CHLR|nr:hypothetical protein [Dehalococcoides mccartyi]WRO06724.1 hypothetical protein VLL09_04865 [Dehalococcoides mccartyi]
MAFLSEAEVRKIIKEELAASPELDGIGKKSVSSWTENDTSGDNADVTVTKAAEEGKSHYVVGIIASYGEAAGGGEVNFDEGSENRLIGYAKDTLPLVIMLPKPYKAAVNTDVSLTVAAGGTGVVGKANLNGFTI